MFEAYLDLLICQGKISVPFYLSCSKSPKIDCNVARKARWIQKEQEQKKTSPGRKENKRHGWVLKLRVVPANKEFTTCLPKRQEKEDVWCSNCCVSTRDLSQESLKHQCYLSARSIGIFKQHEPLASSLQRKTQRGDRPNGNPYDFLFLPRFTKFPKETEPRKKQMWRFKKKCISWQRNSRDSGPGINHILLSPKLTYLHWLQSLPVLVCYREGFGSTVLKLLWEPTC